MKPTMTLPLGEEGASPMPRASGHSRATSWERRPARLSTARKAICSADLSELRRPASPGARARSEPRRTVPGAWYATCTTYVETRGRYREATKRRHFIARIEGKTMNLLWAVAVVFFVLWILGFAAFHVTSGFIHVLLVLALITIVFQLVSGRRTT
jgi:hypothetical protein